VLSTSRMARALALGLLLVAAVATAAESRATDGATSHRRFDDPAYWSTVFDDPARAAWQKPEELVAALGLKRGQCVADLGAGTGYFSRLLSAAVGPTGTVLAVDPEPNLVAHLRQRAEREASANVVPVLASLDNPRLPAGIVDMVLIVDTYHHIDDRVAYLRRLRETLRPPGRVAVVDWQKRELPVGPEMAHKLAREQVVREMEQSGYLLVEEPGILPYQYFLIFQAR
jgi:ubiquinone/menaquinone biosynthesis C-methylase UbiE